MTPSELADKLLEARTKATQGEWQIENIGDGKWDLEQIIVHDGKTGYGDDIVCDLDADKPEAKSNAQFIALAANHVPTLCEYVLRLEKALNLALYYCEGDATWEGLKKQVDEILEGK